jgi:hypothetical protein
METFFACASDAVRIVTGGLNARIYGREHVIVEAKKCLADKRRSLDIIFLSETDPSIIHVHPLLAALRFNDNLRLLQAPADVADRLPFHFTVVDTDTYRFKKDARSHGSITAFGDTDLAGQLLRVFSNIERLSHVLEVAEAA